MQVLFAGAATVATLALFSAAQPGTAGPAVASGSVRLVDQATDLPAPAAAPFGPQLSQTAPSVGGAGGNVIAVDDDTGGGVNDNGQTSGDIFTQNAQDQSTA